MKNVEQQNIDLPTDPDVIEEYLDVLNRIEKERQRTPKGEPIAFPIPKDILIAKGVPLPEQETSILRIFKQDGIIEITEKTIPIIDEFDPYENSETIRAVKIPDLDKFKNYRDKLSELKNQLGKSYKERKADAEARVKEIKRQLEEGVEKEREKEALKKELIEEVGKKIKEQIKPLKELGEQVSSQIQKDFNLKQYREVIKKIDEQAEPIKRTLEQLDAVYSGSVQNSLTPMLQRLTEAIKPIGEQMKRLNPLFKYPEYPKEAFISSDVIRVRQGTETISKLENIEVLLQRLLSKAKKKLTRVEIIKPEEFKIKGLEEGLEKIAKLKKDEKKNKKKQVKEIKTGSFNEEILKTEQLLDKLENDINERARAIEKPTEYKNGILKFRGKEINFRRKPNQKDLLTTLFEEPEKNWSYDEIQDMWDEKMRDGLVHKAKGYWTKFYSAGDGINNAVAIETQVKDFIIKNTKEIRINPDYV